MVTPPLPWAVVPGLGNPFGGEIFPNVQPIYPWELSPLLLDFFFCEDHQVSYPLAKPKS